MQTTERIATAAVSAVARPINIDILTSEYFGLMTLLVRKIGDRELAQDMMHQAIVESLRQLTTDRIADRTRFIGYVYSVAMNLLRNHRRKLENRADLRLDSSIIDALAGHEIYGAEPIGTDLARRVREIIEQLPTPRDREIARRFYLDEHSKETLCRDLRLSPGNFDRITFRIRRRLKALMVSQGGGMRGLLP